jgi:hypothetical protein
MSPEERAIRTAYDHASYTVELGTANQYVFQSNQRSQPESLDDRLASHALLFSLSEFSKTDISQAGNLENYVLQPPSVGQPVIVLDSYPVAAAEGPYLTLYESEATARWANEESIVGAVPYTLRNATLPWVRTIEAFSVTVTLGGITKSYRAFELFGEKDALIFDPVFPSMNDFQPNSQYSLHPTLLLRSASYDSEAGRAYLIRSAGCTEYHCGASAEELDSRLKTPLHHSVFKRATDPAVPLADLDTPDEAGSGTLTNCSGYNYTLGPVAVPYASSKFRQYGKHAQPTWLPSEFHRLLPVYFGPRNKPVQRNRSFFIDWWQSSS